MPDLNLPWIPLFEFGVSSFQLTYPQTPFTFGARTEGRLQYSAAGAPGATVRLRKYLLFTTLRFTEDEWLLIKPWITFAQLGDSFHWTPDSANDDPTRFACHLESPHINDVITPARDTSLPWMMTLSIVLSRTAGPWDIQYFARTSAASFEDGVFDHDAFDEDAFFIGG